MQKNSSPISRCWFAAKLCSIVIALFANGLQAQVIAQNPAAAESASPLPADTLPPDPAAGSNVPTPKLDSALPADPAIPAHPFKLYGGVSHSEALPHVDQSLSLHRSTAVPLEVSKSPPESSSANANRGYIPMNGVAQPTTDSTKQLSAEVKKYTADWFMIPAWMAGRWLKPGDLTLSVTDLRNGQKRELHQFVENRMQATWGHQKDAAGNIWHVNFLPSERDGQSEGKMVKFMTMRQNCEKSDIQQLVTRTQYVVSESDIWSGQPIDMFQQESLNHYMLGPNDTLLNLSTNRVFTYDGQPVRDGQLRSEYDRLTQFVPTQSLNGFDLKQSLNDYLDSHGLAQLKTQ